MPQEQVSQTHSPAATTAGHAAPRANTMHISELSPAATALYQRVCAHFAEVLYTKRMTEAVEAAHEAACALVPALAAAMRMYASAQDAQAQLDALYERISDEWCARVVD